MNKKIIVKENEAGERLDIFLTKYFDDHSRSYFGKLIKEKLVKVNNFSTKPSYTTNHGDEISINFRNDTIKETLPEKIKLHIIYEDENVIVLNKQPGIVVHPASGNTTGTIVNALLDYFPKIKDAVYEKGVQVSEQRPGLVHRLDKDTSGVMIVAKNTETMRFLSKQIQNHTTKKIYWALCFGWPKNETGELINYLGRSPKDRRMITDVGKDRGRKAISYYKVLKYLKDKKGNKSSLIEFNIKTGRTHQIRVQSAKMNNPILGDLVYGNKISIKISKEMKIERQMLHAKTLSITLPNNTKHSVFDAPVPDDFESVLNKLLVANN